MDGLSISDNIRLDVPLTFLSLDGKEYLVPSKVRITNITTIAGGSSGTLFRNASKYAEIYGGEPEKWRKMAGKITSKNREYDIHWNTNPNYDMIEPKIRNGKERGKR